METRRETAHANVKGIVEIGLMAAIIYVCTSLIKIPTPGKGYVNFGDGMVLLSAYLFTKKKAFTASAIGMCLADVLSGYYYWAPFTFIIKGIVALIAFEIINIKSGKNKDSFALQIIGFSAAELFMTAGYYVSTVALAGQLGGAKTLLQRLIYASADVIPNLVQGAAGVILAVLLCKIISKTNLKRFI